MTDKNKKNLGFTLVELMIVVGIIGILASIGYPAYVENTRATNRSKAQADLMELSSFMERNFTEANRYDQNSGGTVINTAALPFQQTPRNGTAKYNYTLAVAAPTFTLTATPAAGQALDKCAIMTINQAAARTATGTGTCWR